VAVSKQQWVYDTLKERILSGVYGPGYRLVLAALARELDVSPVPVREAIRRLEAESWLTFTRNVGATVGEIDTESLEQVVRTLALVEGYATALAAPHLRQKDLAAARRINSRMRKQLDPLDPLEFGRLNRQFHVMILERCPNDHLRAIAHMEHERLDAMRRSLFHVMPQRACLSVDEHDEILDLIEDKAPPVEIEIAAREHKLHLIDAFRRTFAEQQAEDAVPV
jgi:DNA-binding GntR family transcriptional regulator